MAKRNHGNVVTNYGFVIVEKLRSFLLVEADFSMVNKLLIGSIMIKSLKVCNNFPLIIQWGRRTEFQVRLASL